jgi:CcmD family protein
MNDGLGYLFAAYTIIFAAIFVYVMLLWRQQSRLNDKLQRLEARLQELQEELAARIPRSRSAS